MVGKHLSDMDRVVTQYSGSLRDMSIDTLFYISVPFTVVSISYLCKFKGVEKGLVTGEVVGSFCTNPCNPEPSGTLMKARAGKCFVIKSNGVYGPSHYWFEKLDNIV
jgi:hypothetical protein